MRACCELVGRTGAEVVGCAFVLELSFLNGRDKLAPYEVHSLITYWLRLARGLSRAEPAAWRHRSTRSARCSTAHRPAAPGSGLRIPRRSGHQSSR
ncbi:MAG: hypothetical protein U0794_16725 [Isosphaeraceae bacterium]